MTFDVKENKILINLRAAITVYWYYRVARNRGYADSSGCFKFPVQDVVAISFIHSFSFFSASNACTEFG